MSIYPDGEQAMRRLVHIVMHNARMSSWNCSLVLVKDVIFFRNTVLGTRTTVLGTRTTVLGAEGDFPPDNTAFSAIASMSLP